jgi:hypothetical protein
MSKLVIATFLIAASASVLNAQTPVEQPKNEFFAGYSFHSADINTLTIDPHRTAQNGVNLEYTRKHHSKYRPDGRRLCALSPETRSTGVGTFSSRRDQYFVLGGIQLRAGNE